MKTLAVFVLFSRECVKPCFTMEGVKALSFLRSQAVGLLADEASLGYPGTETGVRGKGEGE